MKIRFLWQDWAECSGWNCCLNPGSGGAIHPCWSPADKNCILSFMQHDVRFKEEGKRKTYIEMRMVGILVDVHVGNLVA